MVQSETGPRIALRNGVVFRRPEDRIREYCDIEVYRDKQFRGGYDDRLDLTDSITMEDLEAANNLYARLSRLDIRRILGNREIPARLAGVKDLELGGMTVEEWENARAHIGPLLSAFLSTPGATLAQAMKVLHLKRPHLFPVLDSFVVNFLTGNDMERNRFTVDEALRIGMDSLETARRDIIENWNDFGELRERLSDLPTRLSLVRMYDILCWTQEKWVNRKEPSAPYGVAARSLNQEVSHAELREARSGSTSASTSKRLIDEAKPGRISTIKELRQVRLRAEGVIVITTSSPPRAHLSLCEQVTEERFQDTVIFNEGRGGGYYWRSSMAEAAREFGALPCRKCKPSRGNRLVSGEGFHRNQSK